MNYVPNGERPNPLSERELLFENINFLARAAHKPETELPYHNFNHALTTRNVAMQICADLKANGVKIDEDVVEAAALLHDAGFGDVIDPKVFSSKEAYAAGLACDILLFLNVPEEKVVKVANSILSTEVGVTPQSNEAWVIRRADLNNVASTPQNFIKNNLLILDEYKIQSGKFPTLQEWTPICYKILSTYLEDDVIFGDFDKSSNGVSKFTETASNNIKLLLPENRDKYNNYISLIQSTVKG